MPTTITTTLDQRRENLRTLAAAMTYAELARRLGYKSSTFLIHMAGPNPSRNVTESTARRVETAFGIANGSFDKPLAPAVIKRVTK